VDLLIETDWRTLEFARSSCALLFFSLAVYHFVEVARALVVFVLGQTTFEGGMTSDAFGNVAGCPSASSLRQALMDTRQTFGLDNLKHLISY
jgi:hypothetical protein